MSQKVELVMHNLFSKMYFLWHVNSKLEELIYKITFPVQTYFIVGGYVSFGILFG
jgi:hypothetical protein